MNKLDVIGEIIKLSKRTDYVMSTDEISCYKYSYNKDSLNCITIEWGVYIYTKGGWLKYYTKDIAKYYLLNPLKQIPK
jgi:hypothetical protein